MGGSITCGVCQGIWQDTDHTHTEAEWELARTIWHAQARID